MNLLGRRNPLAGPAGRMIALVVTVVAIGAVAATVDTALLSRALGRAAARPDLAALSLAAFGAAFAMRALAWRRVVPALSLGQALAAIHLALGANHVLPLRLGEPFRVLSATRRANIPLDVATASTVTLRAADMVGMVAIGALVAPAAFAALIGPVGWVLLGVVVVVAAVSWRWLARLAQGPTAGIRLPGPVVLGLAASAWVAESVLVRQAALWAGLDIGWSEALLVTTVAVAAQIAAVAPGGFGTYEAASVAAYASLGHDPQAALVAALTAHGLKSAYSLVAGLVALFVPRPGLVGRPRLRLERAGGEARSLSPSTTSSPPGEGPVVVFLPAYNEEATVADCVERFPSQVHSRPVEVLVVDDGSTDRTAERAREAGAEVLSLGRNRGLGAAVREGLRAGAARGASAVVFLDADGEYPPEELADVVAPVIDGRADYVVGSRFLGRIDHMRPHRRVGNLVLTALLSLICRRRITDGQSGYRALSAGAAEAAEIIHDFNYAQVLTLDLLGKGFRYHEVPISYHFRTQGDSFIKLGPYLRRVVPAVYRELNATDHPLDGAGVIRIATNKQ